MSFAFGVGTLNVMRNLEITGVAATTGSSGAPASNIQIASGLVMIDGITAILSAQSASYTQAGATGTGLLVYAYIPAGNTITAAVAIVTAADQLNTGSNIPTAIAPLHRFSFGTGANAISTVTKWSGGSATKVIAKVQNVNINVTYDQVQMRGGGDVFPVDTQFMNGSCDGSFEFSDVTASHNLLVGGIYVSAGNSSGTWTLSAVSVPEAASLVFVNVTDGVTSTWTIMRAYITEQANEFNRTDYLKPTYNFVAQANIKGSVATVQQ